MVANNGRSFLLNENLRKFQKNLFPLTLMTWSLTENVLTFAEIVVSLLILLPLNIYIYIYIFLN